MRQPKLYEEFPTHVYFFIFALDDLSRLLAITAELSILAAPTVAL